MKTKWKECDVMSTNDLGNGYWESVTRHKVFNGWLISRDVLRDIGIVITSTMTFIADAGHAWEVEIEEGTE